MSRGTEFVKVSNFRSEPGSDASTASRLDLIKACYLLASNSSSDTPFQLLPAFNTMATRKHLENRYLEWVYLS